MVPNCLRTKSDYITCFWHCFHHPPPLSLPLLSTKYTDSIDWRKWHCIISNQQKSWLRENPLSTICTGFGTYIKINQDGVCICWHVMPALTFGCAKCRHYSREQLLRLAMPYRVTPWPPVISLYCLGLPTSPPTPQYLRCEFQWFICLP